MPNVSILQIYKLDPGQPGMSDKLVLVDYDQYREYPVEEMTDRAESFYRQMKRRRTVRDFSSRNVPRGIIENCIRTAGTSVSGANMQPWQFVVVEDPAIKHELRIAAEKEERAFYEEKAPVECLEALAPLGTDSNKP